MKGLKNRIEENGIQCWMDIGQMGGGDALFAKIDAGIRACKVSGRIRIALISPSRDIREFLYLDTTYVLFKPIEYAILSFLQMFPIFFVSK